MAAAINGLHHGNSEEFVDRRGYDDMSAVKQLAILLEILRIPVVQNAFRVPLEGLVELAVLLFEPLPGQDQAEFASGIIKPVDQLKECVRILVVLPSLIPQNHRWKTAIFVLHRELGVRFEIQTKVKHTAFGTDFGYGVEVCVIRVNPQ